MDNLTVDHDARCRGDAPASDRRVVRDLLQCDGDAEPIGHGLSELRINYGPGYRVYYLQRGPVLVILLCGGDKSSQDVDIRRAKQLANEV